MLFFISRFWLLFEDKAEPEMLQELFQTPDFPTFETVRGLIIEDVLRPERR